MRRPYAIAICIVAVLSSFLFLAYVPPVIWGFESTIPGLGAILVAIIIMVNWVVFWGMIVFSGQIGRFVRSRQSRPISRPHIEVVEEGEAL